MLEISVRLPLGAFDLEVERTASGPSVAVFGPSGAGKTSLLEIVAGLRRAEGRLSFAGESWLDSRCRLWLPPERRRVGYVPQEGLLFPHRSVRGNLLAGAGRGEAAATTALLARVSELLELGELLDRDVSTLSGGERQRVALGRALCSAPRLLLLDEPLASLDLPLRRRVLPFLARVRDELALPMLLVSHDPSEVQALADEVLVFDRGKVVAQGEPHRVLTDPAVFPLADERGYETVFDATWVASEGDASRVCLGPADGTVELFVPRVDGVEPHQRLLVGITASEALLATHRPRSVSAQNVLPGRLVGLHPSGAAHGLRLATVELAPGLPPLAVELTGRAVADLELAPGREVYVLLKTAGCTAYHSGHSAAAGEGRPERSSGKG